MGAAQVPHVSSEVQAASHEQEPVDLTEEQQRIVQDEVAFQKSKQMKNQMEAYLDRVLFSNEVPPGLRDQVQAFVANVKNNREKRQADEARMLQLMSPLPPQATSFF